MHFNKLTEKAINELKSILGKIGFYYEEINGN